MTARLKAIITVLAWNVAPLFGLIVWVAWTVTHPNEGEDWSGVIAVILIVYGGLSIAVAAGAGTAIAAIIMTRRLKAGHDGAGVRWGTLSALLGWLVPIAILGIIVFAQS